METDHGKKRHAGATSAALRRASSVSGAGSTVRTECEAGAVPAFKGPLHIPDIAGHRTCYTGNAGEHHPAPLQTV